MNVDWERGNWCEGLTTFMADYAFKEDEGEAPAREMRLGWLRDYAAVPAERDEPCGHSLRVRTTPLRLWDTTKRPMCS